MVRFYFRKRDCKMEIQLILTAFIVGSELLISSVQPSDQMRAGGIINEVDKDGKIQQNLHNLFDSIMKNNVKKTHAYRDILEQEAVRGRQVFDTMKEKLRSQKNADKQNNFPSQNIRIVKRDLDELPKHHILGEFERKVDIWENFTTDSLEILPKVIIFDCDFCLWPFIFDFHAPSPFTKCENGTVMDSRKRTVTYYRGIPIMLQYLRERQVRIGLVNRTKRPKDILEILNALDWMKYVSYVMFHAGDVGSQVKDLIEKERLEYRDVLYFDEIPFNLYKTEQLGIISALAEYGMNPDSLMNGLTQYVGRYQNPRTRSREEIFDEATAGRIKLKATTPVSPWTSRTTSSYYFVCTPRSAPSA